MTAMVLLSAWQQSQVEFWRKIEGFPGYDVSSFGRVGSMWKIGPGHGNRRGDGTFGSGGYVIGTSRRILAQHYSKHGRYSRVGIWKRGAANVSVLSVHRLVVAAFYLNPENKPQVNHLSAVKQDNRLENLAWATRSENMRHAFDSGLYDKAIRRGVNNHLTLFSDDQIEGIRQLHEKGITKYLISKATGINPSTIGRIVTGKQRPKEQANGSFSGSTF